MISSSAEPTIDGTSPCRHRLAGSACNGEQKTASRAGNGSCLRTASDPSAVRLSALMTAGSEIISSCTGGRVGSGSCGSGPEGVPTSSFDGTLGGSVAEVEAFGVDGTGSPSADTPCDTPSAAALTLMVKPRPPDRVVEAVEGAAAEAAVDAEPAVADEEEEEEEEEEAPVEEEEEEEEEDLVDTGGEGTRVSRIALARPEEWM